MPNPTPNRRRFSFLTTGLPNGFLNRIADTLALWSWWRVLAFAILLLVTGSALDDYFFEKPAATKKAVHSKVVNPTVTSSETKNGNNVKITIKDGKVTVENSRSSDPQKTPEELADDLEHQQEQLEQAAEKLGVLAQAIGQNSTKETTTSAQIEAAAKQLGELAKQIQATTNAAIKVKTAKDTIDTDVDDDDAPSPTQTEIFQPIAVLLCLAMVALKLIGGARVREQAATVRADAASATADEADLQRQIAEAKLLRMQAQVEPHFLFNTLAALERLIEVNPTKALAMSQALSQWLRALLPQMKEGQSTLGQEVTLVQSYLQLMQMRMGDRLAFFLDVPENLRAQSIPSMLLQPLVENSIKHGLEPKKLGGEVKIKARKQGNTLELTVEDTGVGFSANPNTGNGLTNLRERLELLFNGKAVVSVVPRNSFISAASDDQALSGTIITIKLPV